ncbi:recombinase family protein [Paraburkholderia caledonica]|uniref:recombinase family protein n=1 Tax=Paraburkholderia caledonica TaxID=134536 RepID=UPI0038B7B2C0
MNNPTFAAGTTAYSYIRFSSAPQERGDSIRRQTELSTKYAAAHGLVLDDSLNMRDEGLSAFDGSNVDKGALGGFLRLARDGLVPRGSVLLVESFDRLSRADTWQAFDVFRQILSQGVTIVTLADGHVFSPESMKGEGAMLPMIMSIVYMARAHEESVRKSQRVRAAWKSKRENAGNAKLTATCPQWMKLSADRKSFELIPESVKVVRRIIELQLQGMGQQSIVKLLNQKGVSPINYRSRIGNGWHPSTIQKISTSPALYGAYQPTTGDGKARIPAGELVEDYFPALITKGEFHSLQLARQDRLSRGRGAKGPAFTNLFSGLLKCGYCGSAMNITGHKPVDAPHTIRSIVCSGAKRGLGCEYFVMWGYDDFERTVMSYLKGVDIGNLINSGSSISAQISSVEKEIAEIGVERDEVAKRIKNLVAIIEEGGNFSAVKDRIAALEESAVLLAQKNDDRDKELIRLRSSLSDVVTVKQSVLTLYERMAQSDSDELFHLRARLAAQVRKVVARINVYAGGTHLAGSSEQYEAWVGSHYEPFVDRRPDKSFRRAAILGTNGSEYFTSTVIDALAQDETDKATTLEALGQAADAERALREREKYSRFGQRTSRHRADI